MSHSDFLHLVFRRFPVGRKYKLEILRLLTGSPEIQFHEYRHVKYRHIGLRRYVLIADILYKICLMEVLLHIV